MTAGNGRGTFALRASQSGHRTRATIRKPIQCGGTSNRRSIFWRPAVSLLSALINLPVLKESLNVAPIAQSALRLERFQEAGD